MRPLEAGWVQIHPRMAACEEILAGGYPVLVVAIARFQTPDAHGFPMEAENGLMVQAEAEFMSRAVTGEALQAGTLRHDGQNVCVAYAREEGLWGPSPACRFRGSRYTWDVYTSADPQAQFLRDKVLPTPAELRHLKNQAILDALASRRDMGHVPRPITFYGLFPTPETANFAANELSSRGFKTTPASELPGSGQYRWSLMFQRMCQTEPSAIEEVTATCDEICLALGGMFDGWECDPVAI